MKLQAHSCSIHGSLATSEWIGNDSVRLRGRWSQTDRRDLRVGLPGPSLSKCQSSPSMSLHHAIPEAGKRCASVAVGK